MPVVTIKTFFSKSCLYYTGINLRFYEMIKKAVTIFVVGLVFQTVHAGDILIVKRGMLDQDLPVRYFDIFEDKDRVYDQNSILDVLSNFVDRGTHLKHIENPASAYWLKIKVKNDIEEPWYMQFMDSHIGDLRLYVLENGQLVELAHTGHDSEYSTRSFAFKNFLFRLPLKYGETKAFLARFASDSKTSFTIRIQSDQGLLSRTKNEYYLLGIFYGIVFITLIINTVLYFFTRENLYLLYVAYVVSCTLLFLSEDGLGFEYLWPSFPSFNRFIGYFSPFILLLTFSLYAKEFVKLKNYMPRVSKVVDLMVVLFAVYFVFNALFYYYQVDYRFYTIPFILIYLASIRIFKKGSKAARYFVIAHSFILPGVLFMVFRKSGIYFLTSTLTIYSLNIGFIMEISILTYALGERIRNFKNLRLRASRKLLEQMKVKQEAQRKLVENLRENQRLKDKLNRELEQMVSERTKKIQEQHDVILEQKDKLQEAYKKLEEQSQEIYEMNKLLDLDNWNLKKDIKSLTQARVLSKEVAFEDFVKIYPHRETCLKFLADIKWKDGFVCKRCGNDKYGKGKAFLSRRCTRCRYEESPTTDTLLHKCKIDLVQAFYAISLIYYKKGDITSQKLSEILEIRQATCWAFMQKVLQAMKEKKNSQGWDEILIPTSEPQKVMEKEAG